MKLERIDDVGDVKMQIYTELTSQEKESIREHIRAVRTAVEKKITDIEVYDENLDELKIYVSYIDSKKNKEQKAIYLLRSEL